MEDIDRLKSEGIWNNDWQASQELIYRYGATQGQPREQIKLDYEQIVAWFQSRYRGQDPHNFDGYITGEPLLMQSAYIEKLQANGIGCGFFSGATRGSAEYILVKRMGLSAPILIAMEDAPSKPDPTGLFMTVSQIESLCSADGEAATIYVGDTVADMYTVVKAREQQPQKAWLGVGVLPPHVQDDDTRRQNYSNNLIEAGAITVLENVQQLTPEMIKQLTTS
jgi:HAD superfamily phosphatase